MAKCISPRTSWPFVIPSDRPLPEDQQTEFQLRSLTGLDWIEVKAAADLSRTLDTSIFRMCAAACMIGLVGWKNFRDPNAEGNPEIPFPGMGRAAVERLDPSVISELGTEIMARSKLNGVEVGKFTSLSGSPTGGTGDSASPATKPGPAATSAGAPQVRLAAQPSASPAPSA